MRTQGRGLRAGALCLAVGIGGLSAVGWCEGTPAGASADAGTTPPPPSLAPIDPENPTRAARKLAARRPPMGFCTWNLYGGQCRASTLSNFVNFLVASGMRDFGYRLIQLDDGWAASNRLADGSITWATNLFPSGLSNTIKHIHDHGLLIGVYTEHSDPSTLQGRPAAGSHYDQDAATFARWGIDYVKCDFAQAAPPSYQACAQRWSDAVDRAGRPMFLHSSLGAKTNWGPWVSNCLESFGIRLIDVVGPDLYPQILRNWDGATSVADRAGPGSWTHMDYIPLQFGRLRDQTNLFMSYFNLWTIQAAPLLLADIPVRYPSVMRYLTNSEVLAINQDPAGILPRLAHVETGNTNAQVWSRPLGGPETAERAVLFFNREANTNAGSPSASITVTWPELGLPDGPAAVRDVWMHTTTWATNGLSLSLAPRMSKLFRITGRHPASPLR